MFYFLHALSLCHCAPCDYSHKLQTLAWRLPFSAEAFPAFHKSRFLSVWCLVRTDQLFRSQ